MSTDLNEKLLDAGAVLAPGTLADAGAPDSPADVLTARSYLHPVLGERRVVRLVPRALGPAEDLAVDFLGLTPAEEPAEVGQVRQEALGFPAWALVHDPANGHHALALVKEMERLAHQARSKPGHAKDGFDELADRLGRAVPHFLPTFCEEVGRIFLALDNRTYAGTWFGRARAAERTFSLEVDEERLRAVFLEFALAGALTVKALRQYVRELAARLDPLTAWQRFRQLCAERSAAGMAPYAGIAEDARALLRAAGLDRAEHEQALLAELLASPAVGRAPQAFWKAWHGVVVDLARRDEAVRARLLEILPTPGGDGDGGQDAGWLSLLAESGAEQLLTGPRPADTEPAARWLQRWTNHLGRGWRNRPGCPATLALVGRMTERLRADADPVDLLTGVRRSTTQLDLLDLLLAAGVPVADPAPGQQLPLGDWVGQAGPESPALSAVAADPRFRPLLRAAVADAWRRAGDKELPARPVLRELFAEWAAERADDLHAARGLVGATDLLDALRPHRDAIAAENPAAAERIAALDVTGLLARALRGGILDELGWPALEEGLRRLGVEDRPAPGRAERPRGLIVEDAWPNLVLALHGKAVVVGPQQVLFEHTLRHPKLERHTHPRMRWCDGELLVAWLEDGKQRAYWSSRPADVFELGGDFFVRYYGTNDVPDDPSLPLPGGGRTTGERPLHAGDTRMPAVQRVFADGTGHWVPGSGNHGPALVEYDPQTGRRGGATLPPAIAARPAAGRLDVDHSRLLPVQPGLEDSPLGTDGTVLGSWVHRDDLRATTTTVDGHTLVLPAAGRYPDRHLVARLTLPGDPGALVADERSSGLSLTLPDPTGDGSRERTTAFGACGPGGLHAAGTAFVPPLDHWHALRPRDEQGSRLLRDLTDEQAAALIDAAWPTGDEPATEPGTTSGTGSATTSGTGTAAGATPAAPERWLTVQGVRRRLVDAMANRPVPVDAVGAALPGLGHPLLVAGVAGVARAATVLLAKAARFVPQPEAERTAEAAATESHRPEHGRDHELRFAVEAALPHLEGFGDSWRRDDHWQVLANLHLVTDLLAAPPAVDPAATAPAGADPATSAPAGDWTVAAKLELRGRRCHGWLGLLGRLDLIASAAAAPLTAPEHRASLALLLDELTRGPLAGRGTALREVVLTEALDPTPGRPDHPARQGEVWRRGDRTVVLLSCLRHESGRVHWIAADHDPSGAFGPVAHFAVERERPTTETLTAERAVRFAALLREHGAPTGTGKAAAAFGEATGVGYARSALLLARPAALRQWYGTVLDADRLQEYGLKKAEADAARGWLRALDDDGLAAVWAALLPEQPEALWSTGPDTGRAAEEWIRRFGRLRTLPEEQQTAVNSAEMVFVEAVLNHDRTPWLNRTTRHRVVTVDGSTERRARPDDPTALPGYGQLAGSVRALHWLAYHLPYESPLRAELPPAAAALRRRLADPDMLLDYDLYWAVKGGQLAPLVRRHFGLPEEGGAADEDGLIPCGPALALGPGSQGEIVNLRPAGLTGGDDPLLELLDGLCQSHWYRHERPALAAILDGEVERLVAPPADGAPAPAEGWAQHPLLSVPALVAEVAEARGLGEDAAVLYLQLLALPDPTDRNTARWTGWKPARLKRARAELAATDLVLEAKRARAGRSLFLPGGWQEAKSPALPAETWKAGLYPLPTHSLVLPRLSVPELFARAWQRVTEGDAPGYEELRTDKRRKGARR